MAKYLKQDCEKGYIEDTLQIEYLKFNNLRHSVLGFMLGDFDKDGIYVVSPEIKDELLKMKKFIADSTDNIEICTSALKLDKHITFMVTYEGERVTLSLVEKLNYQANYKLNSGIYSNINEYVLDQVVTSGVVNRNLIYRRWNIDPFGGQVLDVFNMDEETLLLYAGVVGRFKYLLNANKVLLDKEQDLEKIEEEYTQQTLKAISHYPELKKLVDKEIKETLNGKKEFLNVNKPNFYKTLNEVLDNAIQNNISVLDEKQKAQFEAENKNTYQTINLKRDHVDLSEENAYQIDVGNLKNLTLQESANEFILSSKNAENHTRENSKVLTYLFDIGVEKQSVNYIEPVVQENKDLSSDATSTVEITKSNVAGARVQPAETKKAPNTGGDSNGKAKKGKNVTATAPQTKGETTAKTGDKVANTNAPVVDGVKTFDYESTGDGMVGRMADAAKQEKDSNNGGERKFVAKTASVELKEEVSEGDDLGKQINDNEIQTVVSKQDMTKQNLDDLSIGKGVGEVPVDETISYEIDNNP